ncbi:MAG: serine hydrolase domain-containing protein, partial [Rhodothermales bacterium]|nr:serine hydrolase domain-containing protein [Rhodothermales bacterium]
FAFVHPDTVLLRGYGYADLATRRPVDPATTLFQVASVSKLFTATAVMLLAEEGRVRLDADVNDYLASLQVEEAFGAPVTLAHLLTHTSGIEDRNIGYMARDAASVQPLRAYLAERMPARVHPPGTVISYSNHGYGLAGLVVEEVTGTPFAEAVARRILRPLGMRRSSFALPLPDSLAPHLALGYRWTGEQHAPVPLLYRNVPPAGALSTTAADVARFMQVHLQGGRYQGSRLLAPETVRAMHRQQFTHHERLPGMAYGFIEQHVNGHRALQHGGDAAGYRSLLFLLPEQKMGFFVAYNASSSALREELVARFMDRFFPVSAPPSLTPEGATGAAPFAGAYLLHRYGRGSAEKLFAVFNESFYVGFDAEGYLVTQGGERWVEVAPGLFRAAEDAAYLAFRTDARGAPTHLFRSRDLGGTVPAAYEKLAWYETQTFANEVYLSWIPFLLLTWVAWPVAAGIGVLRRRWTRRPRPPATAGRRAARWVAAFFGVGAIWFALGFIQPALQMVARGGGDLLYGMPDAMGRLLWIPAVQAGLLVALFGFTVQAWRRSYWSLGWRLHYTLFTLAALAWMLFIVQYNLLGVAA